MMHRCLFVLLALSVVRVMPMSPAGIAAPDVGFVRTGAGQVRQVAGLSSSFVLGRPVREGAVVSASFSRSAGLLIESGETALVDAAGSVIARYEQGDAAGIAGITAGPDTAVAWLPSSQTMVWFDGSSAHAQQLSAALPHPVLALRRDGDSVFLLLDEGDAVDEATVALSSGNLVRSALVPNVTPPATYLGAAILPAESLHLPCAPVALEQMSDAWLHAACRNGGEWAVKVVNGTTEVSELPRAVPVSRVQQIGPHSEKMR